MWLYLITLQRVSFLQWTAELLQFFIHNNIQKYGGNDSNVVENLTIRFNGSIEQPMYYKEIFQGDALHSDDMEDEDLEKIYIICQDGEINLFEFLCK